MLTLAPFEHFMVIFSTSYPFKGVRAGYVCLLWLDLSSAHWVDAEWDFPSTESMRSETPCKLNQHAMRLHVNRVIIHGTKIYEDFIIPRWLSWCRVSHRADSVDAEYTWRWLGWRWMRLRVNWVTTKHWTIWINRRVQEQNLKQSKDLLFGLHMLDQCKKLERKNLTQVYL